MNKGAKFKEDALASGVAYNANGKPQANMGVAVGDYDSDGDLDILTTTFRTITSRYSSSRRPVFMKKSLIV